MKHWIERNSKTRLHRLNTRQRKKYHLGEFRETGFHAAVRFQHALSDIELSQWLDDLVTWIEANGLMIGGFGGSTGLEETSGYVVCETGSATDAHREAFAAWSKTHPLVASAECEPLSDAWYDDQAC
ncbi:hypothetical protein SAMN05660284_00432 [Formivibrio citricus]|uniref:DUF469 family protein n=1 Tax=Formivibrio citricus TaxID=83765 RepID=A0A1I4VXD6_9NEIS|nr:50S ribosome-binding protein YggL [Formivibrio citricus]SFN05934.1 hypothetical protein SAMN05660284_00432 [Formivibrio citricus]